MFHTIWHIYVIGCVISASALWALWILTKILERVVGIKR